MDIHPRLPIGNHSYVGGGTCLDTMPQAGRWCRPSGVAGAERTGTRLAAILQGRVRGSAVGDHVLSVAAANPQISYPGDLAAAIAVQLGEIQ